MQISFKWGRYLADRLRSINGHKANTKFYISHPKRRYRYSKCLFSYGAKNFDSSLYSMSLPLSCALEAACFNSIAGLVENKGVLWNQPFFCPIPKNKLGTSQGGKIIAPFHRAMVEIHEGYVSAVPLVPVSRMLTSVAEMRC